MNSEVTKSMSALARPGTIITTQNLKQTLHQKKYSMCFLVGTFLQVSICLQCFWNAMNWHYTIKEVQLLLVLLRELIIHLKRAKTFLDLLFSPFLAFYAWKSSLNAQFKLQILATPFPQKCCQSPALLSRNAPRRESCQWGNGCCCRGKFLTSQPLLKISDSAS